MNEFDKLFEGIERDPEYIAIHAIHDFTLAIERRMLELGISRAALAERLGVSRPHVTQLLRGETNFTIESMVNLAVAVEGSVHISVEDMVCAETEIDWFDHLPARQVGSGILLWTQTADNYESVGPITGAATYAAGTAA